jgi:hypothetical protein
MNHLKKKPSRLDLMVNAGFQRSGETLKGDHQRIVGS